MSTGAQSAGSKQTETVWKTYRRTAIKNVVMMADKKTNPPKTPRAMIPPEIRRYVDVDSVLQQKKVFETDT